MSLGGINHNRTGARRLSGCPIKKIPSIKTSKPRRKLTKKESDKRKKNSKKITLAPIEITSFLVGNGIDQKNQKIMFIIK